MWIGIITAAFIAMGYIFFGLDQIKKMAMATDVVEGAYEAEEASVGEDVQEVTEALAEETTGNSEEKAE